MLQYLEHDLFFAENMLVLSTVKMNSSDTKKREKISNIMIGFNEVTRCK